MSRGGIRAVTKYSDTRNEFAEEYRPDVIRFINIKSFESCVTNETRYRILMCIARGITSAADLANKLGIARTAVYRHLNALEKQGWIIHCGTKFFLASRLYLVYDVRVDEEGRVLIEVLPDRGAFVDDEFGLTIVKGPMCRCDYCELHSQCLRAVKELAKKFDVKLRSENPLEGFKEIVNTLIRRDAVNLVKKGYLILRVPGEEGGV